jgi:hypothetical protein
MATRALALPAKVRTGATGGLGVSSLPARTLVRTDTTNASVAGVPGTAEGDQVRWVVSQWANVPSPKIVQVVYAYSSPQFTIGANTTFNTYVDIPGLAATIQPTSSASQILIMTAVSGGISIPGGNRDVFCEFAVTRNGVIVNYFGYAAGQINLVGGTHYGMGWGTSDMVALDAPGTTDLVNYQIQVNKFQAHGTLNINWADYGSTLVLLEVAP